jgi:hypothetical protein
MGTASEATPTLSGHLMVGVLVIVLPCSSTSHNRGTSHYHNKQSARYTVADILDLGFMEVVQLSYVQILNHLMVLITAVHMQIVVVIRSICKMALTC